MLVKTALHYLLVDFVEPGARDPPVICPPESVLTYISKLI